MEAGRNNRSTQAARVASAVTKALKKDPQGTRLRNVFDEIALEKSAAVFKTRRTGEALLQWLQSHGEIYLDASNTSADGVYWLDKRERMPVLRSSRDVRFASLLARKCGRTLEDKGFQSAKDYLITSILDPESKVARQAEIVQNWTSRHTGKETVCYISNGRSLVKITANGASLTAMGTDGVLIPEDSALPEWEFGEADEPGTSPDELPFIADSGLDEDGKIVFALYITILCLIGSAQVPPLALEGPPASGKTTALVAVGRLLFGDNFRAIDPSGQDAERAIPRLLGLFKVLRRFKWVRVAGFEG
jgi:hypothetical protein